MLQEGNTSTIELKYIKKDGDDSDDDFYDDPEIVKLMVNYFYHFDYPNPTDVSKPATTAATSQPTATDQKKKIREGLQRLKAGNGKENRVSSVDVNATPAAKPQDFLLGHVKVFATAVKYQVDGLRHLATSKFKHETTHGEAWKDDDFAQAISMIYSSTPDRITELRDAAEEVLHAHLEELKQKDGIEALMYKHPRLMYALLNRKSDTSLPTKNPRRPYANGLRAPEASDIPLCRMCEQRSVEPGSRLSHTCDRCYRTWYHR